MKPHIFRIDDKGTRWIISDGEQTLRGGTSATYRDMIRRWEAIHGKPIGGYARPVGIHRLQQMEAFIVNLRRQLPKSCRACGCTDDDCRQCVEATGHACSWVEGEDPPICSRCAAEEDAALVAAMEREGGAS